METAFSIKSDSLEIPCLLDTPDGPIQRLVVSVHGLTGSMHDAIQTALAEELPLFYTAVLRFDLPAHGANPQQELHVQPCVDTLVAVCREARRRYPQVEDLCLFATGFGAYITLLALKQLQQLEEKLRLVIQTPALLMHETILAMLGITRQTLWAMEHFTIPTERPLEIRYDFYEELEQNIALVAHDVPMLMLYGENDPYIRPESIAHFRRLNDKSRQVTLPGMGHRFLEEGAWDMVLDLTRDWFEYQQVVLVDCD